MLGNGQSSIMAACLVNHSNAIATINKSAAHQPAIASYCIYTAKMPMPVKELPPIPPLPKIYSEDKRVNKPEEYFRFAARYQYLRLLGHGAYGMVWYQRPTVWI